MFGTNDLPDWAKDRLRQRYPNVFRLERSAWYHVTISWINNAGERGWDQDFYDPQFYRNL